MIDRRHLLMGASALLVPAGRAAAANRGPGIGLIFVAQSTCPYCRQIAPSLHDLNRATAIDVLVASMDGRGLAPFQGYEDGRTHPLTSSYRAVPVVLVYNRRLDRVTHEVTGIRSLRRFVTRLSLAMRQSAAM